MVKKIVHLHIKILHTITILSGSEVDSRPPPGSVRSLERQLSQGANSHMGNCIQGTDGKDSSLRIYH